MAHIKSRKHAVARSALPSRLSPTTAALALLALPGAVWAQQAAEPTEPKTLPTVKAQREAVPNDYKADRSANPKFTQPLVDTPQTITVIKKEILLQQGATTLSDALGNTPGITFQMGENGNTQTGDSVFMRGFDTQHSIFVDGVRDIGTISRDVFNIEQIEVVKGPAGADIGRGSPTGYINLSTKLPTLEDASSASFQVGSGNLKRVTADFNRAVPALGDGTAVRLNVMKTDRDAVKRNQVKRDSWAIAPSLSLGLNTPTRTHLYYLHVEQDNVPDGGIPAFARPGFVMSDANQALLNGAGITSIPEVDRTNFYGAPTDFDRVKADMFTVRIEHDLKPGLTLRNTSRFGRTEQRYVLTGVNALTIPVDANGQALDPSTWTVARTRQGKDQENIVLTNQTNLSGDFVVAGMTHSVTSGIEFIHEKQTNHTQGPLAGTTTPASLYNPSMGDTFAPVGPTGARNVGSTLTAAVYAFDTLKLSSTVQLNAGLRWEKYKTTSDNIVAATARYNPNNLPLGTLFPENTAKADDVFTYKLGALWKPASNGSVYLAYANAQKPPGSDTFALNADPTSINNPNLDPSTAKNIELGTKWELLDNRLALTAAVYRAEADNDAVDTDAITNTPVQVGKKTVKGLEFGAAGMLTSSWQLNAGLAFMDTEVKAARRADATQEGNELPWSPKLTFTSWTTYRLPIGLTVGGGARYQKSQARNSNSTATNLQTVPSYWVYDAMAAYEVTPNVSLQLNVLNVADKYYVKNINNGGTRLTMGAPRTATLTANVTF